jgi:preprotein translocase subunit SecA
VGTASIESSERLSNMLNQKKIAHRVLNAKFHAQEAEIIAQAGKPGTVTIATNMAGRGTDIVLGGNLNVEIAHLENPSHAEIEKLKKDWDVRHQQVLDAGGLHILGTERHESRRVDNQLRGRAGRQGDPGVTRFYLSLDDDLMRIFASERVRNIMQALGMDKGEAIEHKMVNSSIEKAQRKVEGRNFDIRKSLLEYDDVANEQRQIIYKQRDDILKSDSIAEVILSIREDVIGTMVAEYIPPKTMEETWDVKGLEGILESEFGLHFDIKKWLDEDHHINGEAIYERILDGMEGFYQKKSAAVGEEIHRFEKHVMLQVLDGLWKDHLASMDHLRMGIHFRGYAGKNPKQEYKRESFELFQAMLTSVKYDVIRFLTLVEIKTESEIAEAEERRRVEEEKAQLQMTHAAASALSQNEGVNESGEAKVTPFVREGKKVGRNEPCPCGSGKKYKQCHGVLN